MPRSSFEKTNSSEEKGDKESQGISDNLQSLDVLKETSRDGEAKSSRASQAFGLNFLKDMKDTPTEITRAYDPKQELWIKREQESRSDHDSRSSRDVKPSGYTEKQTNSRSNTGGGRDSDSRYDYEDD